MTLDAAARRVAKDRGQEEDPQASDTGPVRSLLAPDEDEGLVTTTESTTGGSTGIPNLAQRIVNVMKVVKPLAKLGENTFQHYSFVSVQQMIELLRPLMAEQGIAIVPQVRSAEYAEAGQTSNNNPITSCHLSVDWLITDGVTSMTGSTEGEANDTSDKAANKAMTAAYKQLLAKLFHLSSDEDNDTQHIERGQRGRPAPRQRSDAAPASRQAQSSEWGVCPRHGVEFFQTANMERPAHKPTDGGKWCEEPAMKKQQRDIANLCLGKMFPDDTADRGAQLNDWLEKHLPLIAEVDPDARTAADWSAIADAARETSDVPAPAQDDETPW